MRTVTYTDAQADNLYRILRKEFFASYTTEKEKAAADELYIILTNARHEPDSAECSEIGREAGLFRFAPPEAREEA